MTSNFPAVHALARAIEVLRRDGLRVFWVRLMAGLGVYRRVVLLERALDAPLPEFVPALPVEMRLLGESEVDGYLELRPGTDRSVVVGRLRAGQLCFVAGHDGRVISACWATSGSAWTEFLACDLHLGEGEVYLFDAFTEARHRGQGFAPALCLHQLRYFQQAGFRRALRGTFDANTTALRAHAKSGFRPVGTLCRVKVGPWQRCYRRPWPKQHQSP